MKRLKLHRLRQLVAAGGLAAVLAVSMIPPVSAQTSPSSGIGGRTTRIDPNNPRTQSIFIHEIELGKTAKDQVLVVNRSDKPRTITVKSVDGAVTNTGSYACRENAEEVKASGAWVRLAKDEVTLPAGGEEKIDFTITVPENADVGEHNSCLTFMADEKEPPAQRGGVVLRMRQALRVAITIPGDQHRNLSVESLEPVDHPRPQDADAAKQQYFEMTVKNDGNVSADVDMRVRVKSMFGREIANSGGEYVVIPGAAMTQRFMAEFRPLFGGWYTAESSIRYDKRLGIYGTQQQDADYEEKAGPSTRIFLWPTVLGWIILGSLVALIAGAIGLFLSRRRRSAKVNQYVARYKVREGDTLEALSERAGYDWKTIAKLNNLKAPYVLKPGQQLKVPISEDKVRSRRTSTNSAKRSDKS